MRTPQLLAILIFAVLCQGGVSLTYLDVYRNNTGKYTAFGTYRSNLNRLLFQRLDVDGRISGFNETTLGGSSDNVYGLFLCREDVSADACQKCLNNATTEIIQACPSSKEAVIWYDDCVRSGSDCGQAGSKYVRNLWHYEQLVPGGFVECVFTV